MSRVRASESRASLEYAVPPQTHEPSRLLLIASYVALLVGVGYFIWRGPMSVAGQRLWDYAVCASSAQVMLAGGNPYDAHVVNQNWADQHVRLRIEDDVRWLRPIVPPTTLVVLAPFAALPAEVGAYGYLAVTLQLVVIAAWCCGAWAGLRGGTAWRFYASGILLSVPATLGLYSGNPIMLAGPLVLIGLYVSAVRRNDLLGGVLIGIATACKVQIGLPLLIAWLVVGRARSVVYAGLTVAILAAVSTGWLAWHDIDWWESWTASVREANGRGGLNDYATSYNSDDHLNLQVPLWRVVEDRALTQFLTMVLWLLPTAALGTMVLAARLRKGMLDDDARLAVLSAASVLLLIPVYHRTYDAIIVLPAVAASIVLVCRSRELSRWIGWIAIILLCSLLVPSGLINYLARRLALPEAVVGNPIFIIVMGSYRAWSMWLLGLVLTWQAVSILVEKFQSNSTDSEKNTVATTGTT